MSGPLPLPKKGKTHTVLTCVSVSGFVLPHFIIYPRKRIADSLKVGTIPGTCFHCSDNGWVNSKLFCAWFQFFVKMIPPARPVLLDAMHHIIISIEVIELA